MPGKRIPLIRPALPHPRYEVALRKLAIAPPPPNTPELWAAQSAIQRGEAQLQRWGRYGVQLHNEGSDVVQPCRVGAIMRHRGFAPTAIHIQPCRVDRKNLQAKIAVFLIFLGRFAVYPLSP